MSDDERQARIADLERALPDPGKLVALADWLDLKYPEELGTGEVQADLRLWAYRTAQALGMASIPMPNVVTHEDRISDMEAERDRWQSLCGRLAEAIRLGVRELPGRRDCGDRCEHSDCRMLHALAEYDAATREG